MRVYISGPLQGSTDLATARKLYEDIARVVREVGMEPYVPHLHTDPERAQHVTPAEVFHQDVDALLSAGLVIAHVGAPSTGVGAELALAAQAGLQIIAVARAGEKVSRFAEGLIDAAGGRVYGFHAVDDLHEILRQALVSHRPATVRIGS